MKETAFGKDTPPDMLVCHRAAAEEVTSEADSTVDGVGCLFGRLANRVMRDMVSCVVKFNVKIGDGRTPWGEVAHYAKKWASTVNDDKNASSSPVIEYMNWLLVDAECFYMLIANKLGNIVRAVRCKWGDAGGSSILGSFLCGGKLPNFIYSVVVSPWETALDWCLENLGVTLDSGTGGMSYLGCGAIGRVFRVKNKDNVCGALKVTVGKMEVSCLSDEIMGYAQVQHKHLSKLTSYQIHPDNAWGGIISAPVGSKPDLKNRKVLADAMETLENLKKCNILHGDARVPNLMYDEEEEILFWVDLHTSRSLPSGYGGNIDKNYFEKDLKIYGIHM